MRYIHTDDSTSKFFESLENMFAPISVIELIDLAQKHLECEIVKINSIMKAMNYQEGATAIERNGQVGGHRA